MYILYPFHQDGDHHADQDTPSGDHDRSSAHQDSPLDGQDTPTVPQDTTDEDRIETLPQITEVRHGCFVHQGCIQDFFMGEVGGYGDM